MSRFRSLFTLLIALALAGCQSTAAAGPQASPTSAVDREVVSTSPAPTPTPRTLKLVAIGASDLVGIGAENPATEGWAPVLAGMLGEVELVKLGLAGELAGQMRREELPRAIAERPDVVVMWTGTNDFNFGIGLAEFVADLEAMMAALTATGARLYVVNLPDLDRLPAFAEREEAIRAALPAWQAAVAAAGKTHGATVIDLAAYSDEIAAHPEYVSSDGFHPSTAGYRRLAGIIAQAVAPGIGAGLSLR